MSFSENRKRTDNNYSPARKTVDREGDSATGNAAPDKKQPRTPQQNKGSPWITLPSLILKVQTFLLHTVSVAAPTHFSGRAHPSD